MAQQVLPIIGAVVGGIYGGPTGAQAGWAIGAAVGGAVAASEPKPGPSLGELPVQTSYEGSPRAIIYGTATCTGYILAFGDPIKTTEIETGDKGAPKTENEVVYRSYGIAICEGPIKAVLRVWENDKLVYDVRAGSMMTLESAKWLLRGGGKAFYLGDEEQVPDIFLALNVTGLDDTPGYSGTAWMRVLLEDLTDFRGAIPQYRFEVAVDATRYIGALLRWPDTARGPFMGVSDSGKPFILSARDGGGTGYEIQASGSYSLTLYDDDEDVLEVQNVPNQGGSPDISGRIWPIAFDYGGYAISYFGNSGHCALLWYGLVKAYYRPNGISNDSWFYGITGYTPGIAGYIWFRQSVLYMGIPYHNYVSNILMKFVKDFASGVTYPVIQVSNVSSGGSPYFWMHVTRMGNVHAICTDGTHRVWDKDLDNEEAGDIPAAVASIISGDGTYLGFGIDEQMDLQVHVYRIGSTTYFGLYKIDGTLLQNKTSTTPTSASGATRVCFSGSGVYVQRAGEVWRIDAPATYTGLGASLASIVSNLHNRAGIEDANLDASELDDIDIKGLTLQSDGYTASDAISTLQDCYFFDKQEDGELIKYPLRGKPVVTTLAIDDLVETPDLSKREQAGEIPRKVNLMYQNPLAGYAPVKATFEASSPDNKSTLEISTQVAVVLDVDEAQQMVHKVFKVAVSDAQGEIKLSVPDSFINLCPGDCIGLSLRGRVIRLRIEEIEWADGVMNLTCRTDRQSAYTSALTGIPIPPPTLPPSTIAGDTQFAYLDIPARIDSEDDLHYLVAGTSAMPGWYGWELQRSLDGGLNFSAVERWNDRAVMGTLVDSVSAASEHYTDTTNTVRVQLYRTTQVIESQTEQQFLSEGGAFAIVRPDGSAEVMQYLDADDEGDGVFALTTLHRGLLNTGGSAHLAGALFVMLSSAKHVTAQSAWLGMDLTHRAVSLGESPETADIQTNTFVGRSQIEWPVAHLTVERDLSDVLTASWVPRHRFGSDVNPIASANFQGFRVTFDDGGAAVSFDTTGTTYTFDASAMGPSVDVSVAPINRITGLGPAVSETV